MNEKTTALMPTTNSVKLLAKFGERYHVDADKLAATLKATAFKTGKSDPEVTNEQLMALLVVADQYGLNPFTKEIYAFPDQKGGVIPVLSIDGWIRIINERPELESIEFEYSENCNDKGVPEWTGCTIKRKDRLAPVSIREYFAECYRNTGPWNSHPRRMTRHKALIQCARIAFGFGGIYDPDEAERIHDANAIDGEAHELKTKPKTIAPKAIVSAEPAGSQSLASEPFEI